jgi:hypothetical protein
VARAQVDQGAQAELVAHSREIGRRQAVERIAAEDASPAHAAPVGGPPAAEVAEVHRALEGDQALVFHGKAQGGPGQEGVMPA